MSLPTPSAIALVEKLPGGKILSEHSRARTQQRDPTGHLSGIHVRQSRLAKTRCSQIDSTTNNGKPLVVDNELLLCTSKGRRRISNNWNQTVPILSGLDMPSTHECAGPQVEAALRRNTFSQHHNYNTCSKPIRNKENKPKVTPPPVPATTGLPARVKEHELKLT